MSHEFGIAPAPQQPEEGEEGQAPGGTPLPEETRIPEEKLLPDETLLPEQTQIPEESQISGPAPSSPPWAKPVVPPKPVIPPRPVAPSRPVIPPRPSVVVPPQPQPQPLVSPAWQPPPATTTGTARTASTTATAASTTARTRILRRRHPRARRLTVGAYGAVLALAAVALVLGEHDITRPTVPTTYTVIRGAQAEELTVAGVRVQVMEATVAPELLLSEDEARAETLGQWLQVRVEFETVSTPRAVEDFRWISDDGAQYRISDRRSFRYHTAQPGERWGYDVLFEIPAGEVASGTLRVMPEGVDWELPMDLGEIAVTDIGVAETVAPLVDAVLVTGEDS